MQVIGIVTCMMCGGDIELPAMEKDALDALVAQEEQRKHEGHRGKCFRCDECLFGLFPESELWDRDAWGQLIPPPAGSLAMTGTPMDEDRIWNVGLIHETGKRVPSVVAIMMTGQTRVIGDWWLNPDDFRPSELAGLTPIDAADRLVAGRQHLFRFGGTEEM